MYNNVYQEYINDILGNTNRNQVQFPNNSLIDTNLYNNFQDSTNMELEKFYPDLYRVLYPMIQTACMRNTKPITSETIDEMVNEIYFNFNDDNTTVLNINLTNDVRSNSSNSSKAEKISTIKTNTKTKIEEENRVISRRPNNYVLNEKMTFTLTSLFPSSLIQAGYIYKLNK